jgi:hypothetical protein
MQRNVNLGVWNVLPAWAIAGRGSVVLGARLIGLIVTEAELITDHLA